MKRRDRIGNTGRGKICPVCKSLLGDRGECPQGCERDLLLPPRLKAGAVSPIEHLVGRLGSEVTSEMLRAIGRELLEPLLREKKERLARALANNQGQGVEVAPDDLDTAVTATTTNTDDILTNIFLDGLDSVTRALGRFEEESWGKCAVCGEVINPARMIMFPEAATCRGKECVALYEARHPQRHKGPR